MGILIFMKALVAGLGLALILANQTGAASHNIADDQAAIATIVPGKIIATSDGWMVNNRQGTTHVMRDGPNYVVTTPNQTVRLIRNADGFTIFAERPGRRVLSVEQQFEAYYKAKRSRQRR